MLRTKKWRFAILAILPTLAIFAWVRMYPIWETLRLSLHRWDILSRDKPFIGLENFRELFQDQLFLNALVNTTIIAPLVASGRYTVEEVGTEPRELVVEPVTGIVADDHTAATGGQSRRVHRTQTVHRKHRARGGGLSGLGVWAHYDR